MAFTERFQWECPFCFGEGGAHRDTCSLAHFNTNTPPAAPVVHMNGTGWKDLYAEYEAANCAISTAMAALCNAAPNGRDYYVQAPGAMDAAQAQHWERLKKLRTVKAEIDYILMKISDQEPPKRR